MRIFRRSILLLTVLALAGAAPAFAQGGGASSTGSINGQVVDDSGAVLPGVTITLTSPALMGTATAVTNEEGMYRFPSVPPGEYKLSYELAGFSNLLREGIRVTLGFTATVNVKLGVATLQETVTVSGESPTIDTSATRVQTNYTQEQLASIPNARDMWSLLATAPSIVLNRFDVGGSTAGTQTTYFAYGYSGQNRPLIEGINTTEGTSAAGFYLDYGSFEEVFIGAAGNSAEMPNPGVITQFVGKSGGNMFSANLYYDYENEKFQSRNLQAAQIQPLTSIRADGNRLAAYKNLNIGVGGPAIKDKFWLFGGYLLQQNEVAAPPSGVIQDGTIFVTKLYNYTGKGTYQLSPNNKFIGYIQHGTKKQPNRTDATNRTPTPIHVTAASTLLQASPSWVYKGEYNRIMGQSGLLEIRAGQFGYNFGLVNNTDDLRYEDIGNGSVTGGGRDWLLKRRRNQYTGSYALFKDDWLGGSHSFKLGGEYLDETGNTIWNQGYADEVVHFLTNGTPTAVRLYATPSSAINGLKTTSAFVTDSWARDRFTFNLGGRFDRYQIHLPEQSHDVGRFFATAQTFAAVKDVKTFNHIAPRVGAIYDLSGNGKTVLKANWGIFYFNPGVNLADSVNPNTADQYSDFVWADPSGDRIYQPGEEGALQTRFGGVANAFIDPNLENAYTHEASVFLEREVMRDLGVRAGYVWKKDLNGYQQVNELRPFDVFSVPVTVTDPVTGTGIQAFNLDSTTRGSRQVTKNIDGYEGTYKTLELSANKRYSNRYSAVASFSYTWTNEFSNLYFGNRFGTPVSNFTFFGSYPSNPNENGTHNEFSNWNFKLHGTVDAGWGLRVTPVLKHQSGAPYGRIINAVLNYGAQRILVEPIGTRRQENVTILDFRVEKQIRLATRARLGLFFDLFNVLNSNPGVNIAWLSGASFERATTVLPPRIAKFGVKFDW